MGAVPVLDVVVVAAVDDADVDVDDTGVVVVDDTCVA